MLNKLVTFVGVIYGLLLSFIAKGRNYISVDFSNCVFVYDKLNENSLVAAAVLKQYGYMNTVDLGRLDYESYKKATTFIWLGLQPVQYLANKYYKHKHVAFIPKCNDRPTCENTVIYTGNYESVTEMVIEEILMKMFMGMRASESVIEDWKGLGFIVAQFTDKDAYRPGISKAYAIIKMAYDYMNFDSPWDPTLEGDEVEYMKLVKETKHLLDTGSKRSLIYGYDKFFISKCLMIIDHRWYIARRLFSLNGQILRAPRVIDDVLHYCDNSKEAVGMV